jgi:hypothetical protein
VEKNGKSQNEHSNPDRTRISFLSISLSAIYSSTSSSPSEFLTGGWGNPLAVVMDLTHSQPFFECSLYCLAVLLTWLVTVLSKVVYDVLHLPWGQEWDHYPCSPLSFPGNTSVLLWVIVPSYIHTFLSLLLHPPISYYSDKLTDV